MATIETGLPAHFLMGPSSSSRWIPCPGSLRVPHPEDEAGEEARIGTLGHTLAECDLTNQPLGDEDREFLESLSEERRTELEDHVEICVDFVRDIEAHDKLFETQIQSDLIEEHGGTVDVIAYNWDNQTLHVVDFKFGRVKVETDGNDQIQCYINLARQKFPEAKRFLGTIVQPRVGEPQTVEFSLRELEDHLAKVLEASISKEFHAGGHCQYCPLLATCQTAAEHLRAEIEEFPPLTEIVAEVEDTPSPEDIEKLARLYRTFKIAEAASDGAGAILKRWAKRGADLKKHGLGIRISHRTEWAPFAEEELLRQELSPSQFKSSALVSPTQLREALGLSKEDFEDQFRVALQKRPIEALIIGKGGQDEFPEFD